MKEFANILIVRTDRIGDVVLTTPVFKAIKENFPKARLSVLLAPSTKALVQGNPFVDEVLVDDKKKENKGFLGFWRLVKTLKSRRFDCVINYHTKKRTNALCFLSQIPTRIGYFNNKFGFLLTHKVKDTRPKGLLHEARYCLNLLSELGIEHSALDLFLPVDNKSEIWAHDYFMEHRLDRSEHIFAINPSASCPTKRWPPENFITLMEQLSSKYACDFVIIGGESDIPLSEAIIEKLDLAVCDLTGKTDVAQLISLLWRCRMLISNDSGPVHIASAVGIPVISIFTRNQFGINPERWCPLGPKSRYLAPPEIDQVDFSKGQVQDPALLGRIKVAEVVQAVDELFKLC